MPKMKTKKGVKKRFKITKKGRIKRSQEGKSHILTKKSQKRKRNLKKPAYVDSTFEGKIKKLLPYG